jgi:hypothetical protein
MSGFEPPPPERASDFPSFRPLFDDAKGYLALLHLPSESPWFEPLERALAASPDADAELAALFAERNWRCHLVAATALLVSGASPARLDALWGALDAGSWAAPQLAVIAWLLDEQFEARARSRILSARWPKTLGALGQLYRKLPSPGVQVLARLADPTLATDPEARDGALYADEWLGKLARATPELMRARFCRSPS